MQPYSGVLLYVLITLLCDPMSHSVHFDEWGIIILSKVSSSSKLRKERCCQYMIIFRLPSNWLVLMTRTIQGGVGALFTDQMLLQLCLFQKRACVYLLVLGEVQPLEAITFPPGECGIFTELNS